MQRAAEISAQVFTARDAVLRGNLEDLRVGFLLFDSAIETLMVRRINYLSAYLLTSETPSWIPPNRQLKADLNDLTQIQSEEAKLGEREYIHWSFSKTQIGKIEKDFSEKLRFLAWHGDIPPEYVRGVSRLHEYRNEMYHREVTRPDALKIVAHLYASITAEFLDLLKPHVFASGAASDSTVARIYERMNMDLPAVAPHFSGAGFELQSLMAATLRRDLVLEDVPPLIADYIGSRVGNAHDMVEHVREFTGSMRGQAFSDMDAIRMAYGPPVVSNPPTRAMLKRWDDWADGTRKLPDALAAFHSLADFEAEFEEFERIFEELAFHVDEEVDRQIDEAKERRRDDFVPE